MLIDTSGIGIDGYIIQTINMEFVSVGLYGEHLVSYSIRSSDGVRFEATLIRYKGNISMSPPREVMLLRDGNKWWSNADKELMSFLVHDIADKLKKTSNSRKEKAKYPTSIDFTSLAGSIGEITFKAFNQSLRQQQKVCRKEY